MGKSSTAAKLRYNRANYDRIELTTPKGQKDKIKAAADAAGESVNAYINAAIDARMAAEQNKGERE